MGGERGGGKSWPPRNGRGPPACAIFAAPAAVQWARATSVRHAPLRSTCTRRDRGSPTGRPHSRRKGGCGKKGWTGYTMSRLALQLCAEQCGDVPTAAAAPRVGTHFEQGVVGGGSTGSRGAWHAC